MNELSYPYDDRPPAGTVQEIVPGVGWLSMPMPGSLAFINLYLLEDDDGWFVVDTGWANEETSELWGQIFDTCLGGKPVKGVICTHMHPDHVGQAQMITERFECPLYMTQTEYYQARSFTAQGAGPFGSWQARKFYTEAGMPTEVIEAMRVALSSRQSGGFSDVVMPPGYVRLVDGGSLMIGGNEWKIVVGSGHSPEHACLHSSALGIMISGDQILPIITSNVSVFPNEPESNPLRAWLESLEDFMSTPEDTLVLPAHNLPFYGVRTRLRQLIDHHEDRLLAIEESCPQPTMATEFLPVLFKRKLEGANMMMALGEAVAHLHLLIHRNRIERTLDEQGVWRFVSIDPTLDRRRHQAAHDKPSDNPVMV